MDDGSVPKIERIATWMAACEVAVPAHLRGSLPDCIAVTVSAMELQVNPFALARGTSVADGILTYGPPVEIDQPAPAFEVQGDLVHQPVTEQLAYTPVDPAPCHPPPPPVAIAHDPQPQPLLFAPLTITEPVDPTSEPADLKLGLICERLGFNLTAAFVSEVLGIQHSATDKAAKLYRQSDFGRICAALTQHIHTVYQQQPSAE